MFSDLSTKLENPDSLRLAGMPKARREGSGLDCNSLTNVVVDEHRSEKALKVELFVKKFDKVWPRMAPFSRISRPN